LHIFTSSAPRAWLLSLGLLGMGLGSAEPALAAPTAVCDLDCPLGTSCALTAVACPAIACADDNPDCPVCDDTPVPYCAPAACESDDDCGDSMRCAEHTVRDCGGGTAMPTPEIAPASNAADEPRTLLPAPPECESSTLRQCTPRWQLPCTSDADCGEGFRCEEAEACSTPPYDPSSGVPPESEVTCQPSGNFSCVVVETACATEADCPADFLCIDNPNGSCSSSSDGRTECEPADPARVCAPPAIATPTTGGDLVSTSGEAATAVDRDGDDSGAAPRASEGGCTLGATSPASPFALLSTLGLGLALSARRGRSSRG
jgi:hypothetical protein